MKKVLIFALLAAFLLVTLPSCTVNINNTDSGGDTEDSGGETELVRSIDPATIMSYDISPEGELTVNMVNDSGDPDSIWYCTASETSDSAQIIVITSAENTPTSFTSHFAPVSDGSTQLGFNLSRDDILYKVATFDVTVSEGRVAAVGNASVIEFSQFSLPVPEDIPPAVELNLEGSHDPNSPLPAYYYSGTDEYLGIICLYMTAMYSKNYEGDIKIPAPIIYKIDESDPYYLRVWGRFLIDAYDLSGHTLAMRESDEKLGLFTLHKTGDSYEVISFDSVGRGADTSPDIRRICEGDESLVNRFYKGREADRTNARVDYVSAYVYANSLAIDRYVDLNGAEVMLVGVPVIGD